MTNKPISMDEELRKVAHTDMEKEYLTRLRDEFALKAPEMDDQWACWYEATRFPETLGIRYAMISKVELMAIWPWAYADAVLAARGEAGE